ncbi:MAG: hypothetical protein WCO84_09865 [bacterium]
MNILPRVGDYLWGVRGVSRAFVIEVTRVTPHNIYRNSPPAPGDIVNCKVWIDGKTTRGSRIGWIPLATLFKTPEEAIQYKIGETGEKLTSEVKCHLARMNTLQKKQDRLNDLLKGVQP